MITLNSIFRITQRLLIAAALVASFTATAADEKVAPGMATATSPAVSTEAQADRNKSGKIDPVVAPSDAKIPSPPPPQPYCVCCAKGGPFVVTVSSLPSPDFANACKARNAGPVWKVEHTGIIPCSCKGLKGPAEDLKKYVK